MIQPFDAPMIYPSLKDDGQLHYQIEPYDYYVNEYFLAKSLIYVLRYKDDEVAYEVALLEAMKLYKTQEKHIRHHVSKVKETLKP